MSHSSDPNQHMAAAPTPEDESQERLLSRGRWDDNISWEFIIASALPDPSCCTAVCCILMMGTQFVLVRNRRGWEFPAGHLEEGETPRTAVIREVAEEAVAHITTPRLFGYKRLIAKQPVLRHGGPSGREYYPFPHSYVAFFIATLDHFLDCLPTDDVEAVQFVSFEQARSLLAPTGQYIGVLEYLRDCGDLIEA